MLLVLMCFFLIFMYSINYVYISNILYYFVILNNVRKRQPVKLVKNSFAIMMYFIFILWVTLSTAVFSFQTASFSFQNFIQYFFTLQYFILIIDIGFNCRKFELWIYRFSIVMSIAIIALFFYTGTYNNVIQMYSNNRMWGESYLSGWPNDVVIPLLVGLWISIWKKSDDRVGKILILVALALTTSRLGLLGGTLIVFFYCLRYIWKKKMLIVFSILLIICGCLFVPQIVNNMLIQAPTLRQYWLKTADRVDIVQSVIKYVELRPLLGFGGNSLAQITNIYGNFSLIGANWAQAHNWILEMSLRYGLIGMLLFSIFLISLLNGIRDKDKKLMFFLFIIFGLFQVYMRSFVFLFFMVYFIKDSEENSDSNRYLKQSYNTENVI